jgi:ubiquinone/menaquinone biosynthesis C-methylase UbiE
MTTGPDHSQPSPIASDEISSGVFDAVLAGYDAVYAALPRSDTFNRLWRSNAYRDEFPAEFAHIGFLTIGEAQRLLALLAPGPDEVVVDVACGTGGPGLWTAQQAGAWLIGVDPSPAGLAAARQRASRTGLDGRSRFEQGSFENTQLPGSSAGVVMSIEAFQYAPDKRAGLREFARILRPGGRLGLICFETDPAKTAGLPILGVDPVGDYRPLLRAAGFDVVAYEETPGWAERVQAAYSAIVSAADMLAAEMGEQASASAVAEAMITLELRPYPRRILTVASLPG